MGRELAPMLIRKFDRATLESEPHNVLFKDLYPWDEIEETPFGSSLAVVEPGGQTQIHSHHPCETFVICQGRGTMTCDGKTSPVSSGDVIYLPPRSVHKIQNDSDTDPLMFLSVFWDEPEPADEDDEPEDSPVAAVPPLLFWPSPPTPNGGLHLGHLSGPYLMADVLKRYHRLRGRAAGTLVVLDEHQSYVPLRAHFDQADPAATAARYGQEITALLKAFGAEPDAVVNPSQNPAYRQAVETNLAQLVQAGFVRRSAGSAPYCEGCQRYLYDGFAAGSCPHCQTSCRGSLCETCCMVNTSATHQEVHCLICDAAAVQRPVERLVFSLTPFKEALAQYHSQLRLSPRMRVLARQFMAVAEIEVSQPGNWGIPVEIEGQILSPWFEVSLAGPALTSGHEVINCFGADNAFFYLMQDPAVSLALDPSRVLPTALFANEYLMLEDQKMSTSRGHALDAAEMLKTYSPDLLRLYLAGVRPEHQDTRCSLESMQQFLQAGVVGPWQDWLEQLGKSLLAESASKAPPPPQGMWPEQQEFYTQLNQLLQRTTRAYDLGNLPEVTRCLHELVHHSRAFAESQQALVGMPERAISLSLGLAAVKLMASLCAPLMPQFSEKLWKHLGYRSPEGWPQGVDFLPGGQRVLAAAGMASRRYF